MSRFETSEPKPDPIEVCNELLRSERLTDDVYKVALDHVREERLSHRLTGIRLNHLEAILLLKRIILQLGGEPTTDVAEEDHANRIQELKLGAGYEEVLVGLLLDMERLRHSRLSLAGEQLDDRPEAQRIVGEELLTRARSNTMALEKLLARRGLRARQEAIATEQGNQHRGGVVFGGDETQSFSVI